MLFKVVRNMAIRFMDGVGDVGPLPLPLSKKLSLFAIIAESVNFDFAGTIYHVHDDIILFKPLSNVIFFMIVFGLKNQEV